VAVGEGLDLGAGVTARGRLRASSGSPELTSASVGCPKTEVPEQLYSRVIQIQKTTGSIDFAVTIPYTYRLLEEINKENAAIRLESIL